MGRKTERGEGQVLRELGGGAERKEEKERERESERESHPVSLAAFESRGFYVIVIDPKWRAILFNGFLSSFSDILLY